ncbi:MAG: NUDIX hydrolase [Minisyncoccia bacterium]|jgi:ADP-ribose pyrophosphatase YjhB (NUDIX family)
MLMTESSEYYKSLPKKRMGAGALFFNKRKELLIVRPTYKNHWSIPGGVVDANESPREACVREIKEEMGLTISEPRFLCVAYYKNPGVEKGEGLQFMFYGGIMDDATATHIVLQKEELSEYKFVPINEAIQLLGKGLAVRLPFCMEAIASEKAVYLERESSDS